MDEKTDKQELKNPSIQVVKNCEKYRKKELFLFPEEEKEQILTGEILLRKMNQLGSILQKKVSSRESAVILLPQGSEYIVSLLTCFVSNITAIPAPFIDTSVEEQVISKLLHMVKDSNSVCIITDACSKENLEKNPEFKSIFILSVDEVREDTEAQMEIRNSESDDLAVLLYTSGSTSQPKGVMLSYKNLFNQSVLSASQWELNSRSCIVSWLPQFHNFGLHMDILCPFLYGIRSVILTQESFILEPEKWLFMIQKYKATHTGAPNFAFDYCCTDIPEEKLEGLDLSSLKGIICGGEPVRKETYERFSARFAKYGIKDTMFCPLYGMSEAGCITTKKPGRKMKVLTLDVDMLEAGKVKYADGEEPSKQKYVLSCGEIGEGFDIICVNPETGKVCSEREIGEVWIKSIAVSSGYLNRQQENKEVFSKINPETGEDGYFRTGDLGFIKRKELFLIGRQKDVLIINGKNYHPVDIEWVVKRNVKESELPLVVFGVHNEDRDKLVILQEAEVRNSKEAYQKLCKEILDSILKTYPLEVQDIILLKKGTIPKTGSGKLQKKTCKVNYENHQLDILYSYFGQHKDAAVAEEGEEKTKEIVEILKTKVFYPELSFPLSELMKIEEFSRLKLDSIRYVRIAKRIEKTFSIPCSPVMLFTHQSFQELATSISSQISFSDGNKETILKQEKGVRKEIQEKDIVVVGMSCHFPGGADDTEAYWKLLSEGKDGITSVAAGRPEIIQEFDREYGDTSTIASAKGGFLNNVAEFDASFFGISPLEAECMDPQQRKLMELTWNVLEQAGYNPKAEAGKNIGLFIGVHNNDYGELIDRRPELMDLYGAYVDSGLHMTMITNRVSRWFDFHGPSEVINTACSSSLVAVQHAVYSLQRGECSEAVAGGINIILGTKVYASSQAAGMLSPDGYCKTFDESANGFVRSEGYGAVLLKTYRQALEDRDVIYGVIKAAETNHDGQSNSLRAPNPVSQKKLIQNAILQAGIKPETISYVETHGTGTALGDPIEVQALKDAFEETGENQLHHYCGLGSAKTNIGHCESAAGIAGMIKVLLSMKHKILPGMLHFHKLNPYISLEDSPFYLVDKKQEWTRFKDSDGKEVPRRAGVSAFGFGGENAHVILEEYIQKQPDLNKQVHEDSLKAVLLSAQKKEILMEMAGELEKFLSIHKEEIDMESLAYTLQTGRFAMKERAAFLVKNAEELIERLHAFQNNEILEENCWQGSCEENSIIEPEAEWMLKQNVDKLIKSWVKGAQVDWSRLYQEKKPKHMALPVYPFERTKYWFQETEKREALSGTYVQKINSVLHKNETTLEEIRFSSVFDGKEPFIRDHVMNGQKVLPAAVVLEMVRTAVSETTGDRMDENNGISFENVVWIQPVLADQQVKVLVRLYVEEKECFSFEVTDTSEEDTLIYCQGTVQLIQKNKEKVFDLEQIQEECKQSVTEKEIFYKEFSEEGMQYGDTQRVVETVYMGEDKVLGKLKVSEAIHQNVYQNLILPPDILDSALQVSHMLTMEMKKLYIPFSMEKMTVLERLDEEMWVLVKERSDSKEKEFIYADITLLNRMGKVCVSIKKAAFKAEKHNFVNKAKNQDVCIYTPEIIQVEEKAESHQNYSFAHMLILCSPEQHVKALVQNTYKNTDIIIVEAEPQEISKKYRLFVAELIEKLKQFCVKENKEKLLVQVIIENTGVNQIWKGLSGLLKTAHLENPSIYGQIIMLESWRTFALEKITVSAQMPEKDLVFYQDEKLFVQNWKEQRKGHGVMPWKDFGCYVISGGAGGIGLLFAQDIAQRVKNPSIILMGRSALSEKKKSILDSLEKLGAKVTYLQVDITDKKQVEERISQVEKEHKKIDGVIHNAGIIKDCFLIQKKKEDVEAVIAAKAEGIVNLDQAAKDMKLDFFVCASSIAAAFGNIGQADYAAGNGFMDAYAVYRNELVKEGKRTGTTVSISWPLWQDGSMEIADEIKKVNLEENGMGVLSTEEGIQCLYDSIGLGTANAMVLAGNKKKFSRFLKETEGSMHIEEEQKEYTQDMKSQQAVYEDAIKYFKKVLSDVTRTPISEIRPAASFDQYGIDSVMILKLTRELEKRFGTLSKTLFFEYQDLKSLVGYFMEHYFEVLCEVTGTGTNKSRILESRIPSGQREGRTLSIQHRQRKDWKEYRRIPKKTSQDIAIVGLSGRYPNAQNMKEFWEMLAAGTDCITEIPEDRWDYRKYFSENKNEKRKAYTKWGGFLDGVDCFDPFFFHISPKEAEQMDPQERLFLQCSYEAIEDAGYTKETICPETTDANGRNVGVFVGVMYEEYQLYGAQSQLGRNSYAVSGNISSIANRVSYFNNFHGPSIAVDTMCSSSLTALHLACNSILQGECQAAVAGGVNLSLHPNKFLLISEKRFASAKGRCAAFGDGGDGYVPGEGVGAVLLKPLWKAEQDQDHIYGVIKATAINHGGKTNGYTVPNPNAQAMVIGEAYEKAGIRPESISYIETHGTGTALGDPIEISALSKVFNKYTQKKQYCAIGSVKSNIGHCESAAGIAGLTKILLQMRYGKLAPSLHCEKLNENIDFIDSPFYVQKQLEPWEQKQDESGNRLPRRAALSAFGAGGSNAHVVIEEYIKTEDKYIPEAGRPAVLILSARNQEQLKQKAEQLKQALYESKKLSIYDAAYTLQVGREAMEIRTGFTASSIEEAIDKLERYYKSTELAEDIYVGTADKAKEFMTVFHADEDINALFDSWISKGKYEKILELWVNGMEFDWERLYEDEKPKRISLPSYPFAEERYWLPDVLDGIVPAEMGQAYSTRIHPLLQENVSNIYGLQFQSIFTGNEFYLEQHVIKGKKILPAAAYIEMARAAGEHALVDLKQQNIVLKDMVWMAPLVVEQPTKVQIALEPQEDSQIHIQIAAEISSGEDVLCSQGSIMTESVEEQSVVSLDLVKKQCNQGFISKEECYETFEKKEMIYGKAFQGIEKIYTGEETLLAKIVLPQEAEKEMGFFLNPAMLDAALQAAEFLQEEGSSQAEMPIAVQEVHIYEMPEKEMWAYVTYEQENGIQPAMKKYDIRFLRQDGTVSVWIKGLLVKGTGVEKRRTWKKEIPEKSVSEKITSESNLLTGNRQVLFEKTTNLLKKLIGEELKIPAGRIQAAAPLEEYGIDSVVIMELTDRLKNIVSGISNTLFFEYQNIEDLVEYLIQTKQEELESYFGLAKPQENKEIVEESQKTNVISQTADSVAEGIGLRRWRSKRGYQAYQKRETNNTVLDMQDIAIIGLSGKYAQSEDLEQFWENLKQGRSCISEIPKERWDWKTYYSEQKGKEGTMYTKWGGFLSDVDKFDPLFFHIAPREAERMDPQERLFLETVYQSIQDAGYTPEGLSHDRKIGVFAGVMNGDYTTGAKYWSVANRVSYVMDFQGPSMCVDTACASSLTAIHLAVESLHCGTCDCAVAGGVNLILSPKHMIRLSEMTMLSKGNKLKAFGEGGDGFVDGEGVGAIVLKPLQKAMKDGDHIYGVIKGSFVNAGGKTNGYTVPNPKAQAKLIAQSLKRAGVDARTISYVEAHGTGTQLGDPIEITALSEAFGQNTKDTEFCAIGSVKANIGHCESASGIAAVTKVLLQMRYKKLVPSIHSETLNTKIDFEHTPFTVQKKFADWKQPHILVDGMDTVCKRRAAVSSFGAGGANAHLILEEYIPKQEAAEQNKHGEPVVVLLSAANREQLTEQIRRLLTAVKKHQITNVNLSSAAFTLQTGREALEERMACIVSSVEELEEKLSTMADGNQEIDGVFFGQEKGNREIMSVFLADRELKNAVERWMDAGKLSKLADFWTKGLNIDWMRLYKGIMPKRMSLPGYPFAKESYWIAEKEERVNIPTDSKGGFLHPLLHKNSSDFQAVRYSTIFTGEEEFLQAHRVAGKKVVPGAVCLEMARAAVSLGAGTNITEQSVIQLKDVVWENPAVVEEKPVEIKTVLMEKSKNEISFEQYGDDTKHPVFCRGTAIILSQKKKPSIQMDVVKQACQKESMQAEECYEVFETMGLSYGKPFQSIQVIEIGDGILSARLSLPEGYFENDSYILYPSMVDGAFQSGIGFSVNAQDREPTLPISVDELTVYGRCTSDMYAVLKSRKESHSGNIEKMDIYLCDRGGNVLVQMKGFAAKKAKNLSMKTASNTMVISPCWKEKMKPDRTEQIKYARHKVITVGFSEEEKEEISRELPDAEVIEAKLSGTALDVQYQRSALEVFDQIQKEFLKKNAGNILIQVVAKNSQKLSAGISGMLKTAEAEDSNMTGQMIVWDGTKESASIGSLLKQDAQTAEDKDICYENGRRLVRGWQEEHAATVNRHKIWRDQGVYLITGGTGGLGRIFVKEIAKTAKQPVILLTGRSTCNEEKKLFLDELRKMGAQAEYLSLDVTKKEAVESCITDIRARYGTIHGILHAAGVVKDKMIRYKTTEDLQKVIETKVSGLVHLDEAAEDCKLDFFILFSSIAGGLGNPGQADYAAANAFMNEYAGYRNALQKKNLRSGRTISIGWPLWKEGGMHITERQEQMMEKNTGMKALDTKSGIRIFYESMGCKKEQVLVFQGDVKRIRDMLKLEYPVVSKENIQRKIEKKAAKQHIRQNTRQNVQENLVCYLKSVISETLKIDAAKIDIHESLERYGMDSVMILDVNNKLRERFEKISTTLFFEYSTVGELAEYFMTEKKDEVETIFGGGEIQVQEVQESVQEENQEEIQIQSEEVELDIFKEETELDILKPESELKEQSVMESNSVCIDDIINAMEETVESVYEEEIPEESFEKTVQEELKELSPICIHERDLDSKPELSQLIQEIDRKRPQLGYDRLLYQTYFILSGREKYIRLYADEDNKLMIPYLGLDEESYEELSTYCKRNGYQMLVVDRFREWLDNKNLRLLPIGVCQDIDLTKFTLRGNKMRKLRYLVEKFKGSGDVRVEEYLPDKPLPLVEMRQLMIDWGKSKNNVIKNSVECMKHLLQRKLPHDHRAFLTYRNDSLCSIIVVEKDKDNIYLMDQEFYNPETAALGHMEYTITEIIRILEAEQVKVFSLGLTWYPYALKDYPKKDEEAYQWLEQQEDKQTLLSKIYAQGKSNFQFKKKFGTTPNPVYAYLDENVPYRIIMNYWPLFYQNSMTGEKLEQDLKEITLLTEKDKVEDMDYSHSTLDMITDSWFGKRIQPVVSRKLELFQRPMDTSMDELKKIFPFKHIILTKQGRFAEELFYKAFDSEKKKILTTVPWLTTLIQELENGFDVIEVPDKAATNPEIEKLFKGELDTERLKQLLEQYKNQVALAGLEVLSNGTGGHPVRLEHMHQIRKLLDRYQVPLVLDASRIVRNGYLVQEFEKEYQDTDIWEIVKETSGLADHIVTSLSKDFTLPFGGMIATNEDELAARIRKLQIEKELVVPDEMISVIVNGLKDRGGIEKQVKKQMQFTRKLGAMLESHKVPIMKPVYGHAVAIDISDYVNGKVDTEKKQLFLKKLFMETGIRGSVHQIGKQKNTVLDHCIRLACPLGLNEEEQQSIYEKLDYFYEKLESTSLAELAMNQTDTKNDTEVKKENGRE